MSEGKMIVISGFSGAGKGTLMKELMRLYADKYALSISATTRSMREGEKDGVDYFFVTKEKFEAMIEADELVEYARYVENYYGTPKAYVNEQLIAGKNVILEIEIQGALNIKKLFPQAILMFVTAPSAAELKRRLIGRGTETADVILARLSRAIEESKGIENYDYLIINDSIEQSVALIDQLIYNERSGKTECNEDQRVIHHMELINQIRTELTGFAKGE